jgi:hypothetical protein
LSQADALGAVGLHLLLLCVGEQRDVVSIVVHVLVVRVLQSCHGTTRVSYKQDSPVQLTLAYLDHRVRETIANGQALQVDGGHHAVGLTGFVPRPNVVRSCGDVVPAVALSGHEELSPFVLWVVLQEA